MKRLVKMLGAAAVVSAGVAWACGPFFPERMLVNRSAALLRAPLARMDVGFETLHRNPPNLPTNWNPGGDEASYATQTQEVDVRELAQAMAGKPGADVVIARYKDIRTALMNQTVKPANGSGGAKVPALKPPEGIPDEFADYLRGAIARIHQDTNTARKHWEQLLQRPAQERRFRSTWAAFMLGVSYHGEDSAKANRWYQETRSLAAQGFHDGLGLGAASLGRDAQIELRDGHFERAAQLYLDASAAGDPYGPPSLRELSWALLKASKGDQQAALKLPSVREVLGVYLASVDVSELTPDAREFKVHALLLEETRGEQSMAGADRLAWFAYRRGDIKNTEEWLKRAPEKSPISLWIRSKLLARQGKFKEAAQALSGAVDAFPLITSGNQVEIWDDESGFSPQRRLRGELAVLKLARGQYQEALELLLKVGYWRDAAHIAERVLSLKELQAYVDANWPASSAEIATLSTESPAPGTLPALTQGGMLRYLLARRLARADRWQEATPYFPSTLRPFVATYREASEGARDRSKSAEARAGSLWSMARIEREKGMELLGMELGPDWRVDDGNFDEDSFFGRSPKETLALHPAKEKQRERQSAPAFGGRFHYRYIAARHAMEASKLLPDRDPKVSEMLCSAFSWLKNRDAKAARPYAQEAKRRGGSCSLAGKLAIAIAIGEMTPPHVRTRVLE